MTLAHGVRPPGSCSASTDARTPRRPPASWLSGLAQTLLVALGGRVPRGAGQPEVVADAHRSSCHGRLVPAPIAGGSACGVPEDVEREEAADEVLRAEGAGEVRALVAHLSEREREAVALRFSAELSAAEIGDLLGTSATGARTLVHRAVTKLRGMVADG